LGREQKKTESGETTLYLRGKAKQGVQAKEKRKEQS